ncbi:hypothetical protein [Paenibacillus odorifer]|uniref:hypothetical protein n=1 Tax=Paenibacillus odorifer TaxID=189426 RepID=UPI0015C40646|nr:hypothetical protein [Paenibacillus odorifer]
MARTGSPIIPTETVVAPIESIALADCQIVFIELSFSVSVISMSFVNLEFISKTQA